MPVGLCGHVTEMSRVVPGPHAARRADRCRAANASSKREVDDVEVGADRAGRLEVGRVVGAHDDRVVARLEQRRRGREQRGGRARRDEHVVGAQAVAARGDGLAEQRVAEVVAVAEQQLVERRRRGPEVDPEVGQPPVGDRALREVVGDRVVAELLGRLDLDGHPSVAHGGSFAGRDWPLAPPGCEHMFVIDTSGADDPPCRSRRVLRVGGAARRPTSARPAGDRGRRGGARRELRGEGVRDPHRDGRPRRRAACARGRSWSSRASPRTSKRARRCSRCSRDTTPLVEGLSIDEAFLDVGGLGARVGHARSRSRRSCGARCSSGSAWRSRSASRARSSSPRSRAASPSPTVCSSCRPTASSRSSIRFRCSGCGASVR